MKKETIFKHEINESIQANAAMNCLKNRNNPKQLNETSDFDNRFALRKDLKGMANDVTKKAYMFIRKEFGDSMWRQLGMDDCDEQGLISQINDYQKHYGITDPQAIVNKMLGRKATEQEETVDIPQLAEDVVASYRGRLSKMDEKERVNFISTMVMKKMGKTIDTLTPQEKKEILAAAKHSMWYVSEQEEDYGMNDLRKWRDSLSFNGTGEVDNTNYDDDSVGIDMIADLLVANGEISQEEKESVKPRIKELLDEHGLWIGEDEHEAERFISLYWDNQEQEEDGINKGGMHNSVQVGHIMNTPSMNDGLDTEWFSDLEEQEAYYENFRAIAELVADQIDRENGKGIDNNMDTLFAIVREVWNNNPDDLYIWDFDDVQEDDCYKFFDKYYEIIKNEYLKREHNNIMAATHDDLFAS